MCCCSIPDTRPYVHKIATGRCAEFNSLRQTGGLSGYPSRTESIHDVIENSHASTALSYAHGLGKVFALHGSADRRVVTIVGDGTLTDGMCRETLNNLGAAPDRPVIIVLNDNGRSSSPTAGGLAATPQTGNSVFENLGLAYLGPVDGHDIAKMESACGTPAGCAAPLWCIASPARAWVTRQPSATTQITCTPSASSIPAPAGPGPRANPTGPRYFADEITAIGAARPDVVCVTAAMLHPTGLDRFAARFPDRVFDLGIAEQHAVTSATRAGPRRAPLVLALYSTFVSRAFDQLLTDVALHRLPVTLVLDRAGSAARTGPATTACGMRRLCRSCPGLRIAAPRDCTELRELLREAAGISDGPTVIRYPKATLGPDIPAIGKIGQGDVLRNDAAALGLLVTVGAQAGPCLTAAHELAAHNVPVTVVNPRWIAPVNLALLTLAAAHRLVLTVEDSACLRTTQP